MRLHKFIWSVGPRTQLGILVVVIYEIEEEVGCDVLSLWEEGRSILMIIIKTWQCSIQKWVDHSKLMDPVKTFVFNFINSEKWNGKVKRSYLMTNIFFWTSMVAEMDQGQNTFNKFRLLMKLKRHLMWVEFLLLQLSSIYVFKEVYLIFSNHR